MVKEQIFEKREDVIAEANKIIEALRKLNKKFKKEIEDDNELINELSENCVEESKWLFERWQKEFCKRLKERNTINHQITIQDVEELAGERFANQKQGE